MSLYTGGLYAQPVSLWIVCYYWVLSSEYIACSWVWILSVKLQCTGERFAATSRPLPHPWELLGTLFIDKRSHFTHVRLRGWSCWYSVWCSRCRSLQLASSLQWGGDRDTYSGGKHAEQAVHQCEGYFREPWECFVSFVCKEIGSEGLWFLAPIMSPGPKLIQQDTRCNMVILFSHFCMVIMEGRDRTARLRR